MQTAGAIGGLAASLIRVPTEVDSLPKQFYIKNA